MIRAFARWRPSISVAIPLLLGLFLVLVGVGSLWAESRRQMREFEEATVREFSSELSRLSLQVIRHLDAPSSDLPTELARLSSHPDVTSIAVLNAAGEVLLANRQSWAGQSLTRFDPQLRIEQLLPALMGLQTTLDWSADRQHLTMMRAFRLSQGNQQLRGIERGLVYLTLDLGPSRALRLERIWQERLPELAGFSLALLMLGMLLQHLVARPLRQLGAATARWGQGQLSARAEETGSREIADLARACNDMAQTLERARADLEANREQLSTILYSTGDALLATDTLSRITLLNPVAEALTGWTEQEARGRTVEEVFRIEQAETGLPAVIPVRQVLDEGVVVGLANHTVLVARHGKRTHIADSAAPVRRGDGSLVGVVIVFRDVDEAYRLEQALADSEFRYRALADAGASLLATADTQGNLQWFNRCWLEFTGQSERQAVTSPWQQRIHPDDLGALMLAWRELIEQRQALRLQLRMNRHDGIWRWVWLEARPWFGREGQLLGHLVHGLDITEQREVNRQLEGQIDELQRWHQVTLEREQRVIELKREINALSRAHRQPVPYPEADIGAPQEDRR
ncbi:PAS domain S-box-containing protein [Sphaerotilus hippei]|uniref:PAS domain S-box-containing protein n=1 Tax=Sphaerotilus hippei TaxID=744406 RepID=A0A318H3Q3_9BURK|nr:PAS domain S-box protein [Sphaerotilus hippei]PXW98080.1 PAS domain S-box-containing protein [Sphaerotilus hippei]